MQSPFSLAQVISTSAMYPEPCAGTDSMYLITQASFLLKVKPGEKPPSYFQCSLNIQREIVVNSNKPLSK
jgi:hypothetical protein